jgi:hypothetical protein
LQRIIQGIVILLNITKKYIKCKTDACTPDYSWDNYKTYYSNALVEDTDVCAEITGKKPDGTPIFKIVDSKKTYHPDKTKQAADLTMPNVHKRLKQK